MSMSMAMAHAETERTRRPAAITSWKCLLLSMSMVATLTSLCQVTAARAPPTSLVVYVHVDYTSPNRTVVVENSSPSSSNNPLDAPFGTFTVVNNIIRTGRSRDSTMIGVALGDISYGKNALLYSSLAYLLDTGSNSGTINFGGVQTPGTSEQAVLGGAGDFRFARGYVTTTIISDSDPSDVVIKNTFTLSYSC